jgi:hypothetical protein
MEECSTCIEPYNRTTRRRIACPFCGFETCLACAQYYILSVIQDPHCSNCKNVWSRGFMDERFPKQFVNHELKEHREEILYEQEKNLLAQTQVNIKLLNEQRALDEEIERIQESISAMEQQVSELEYKRNLIRPFEVRRERNEVMIHCPSSDCRGFVENTMACGICSRRICETCHEIDSAGHACRPETVESVRLMQNDTKRCPNCAVRIFKTTGCPQMWCTHCNSGFDWDTGEPVRGIIHNPHYYQYLEAHGGHLPPAGCDGVGFVTTEELLHALRSIECPAELFHPLIEVYRHMIHYHQVDLPRLPTRFSHDSNLDLRVRFLINGMSEEEFKTKLQRRQKDTEKKIEYRDILETYIFLLNDMFRLFLGQRRLDDLVGHIRAITQQAQLAVGVLNKRYTSSLTQIRAFL